MIKSLYNTYFQKSKSFLYPLLGIVKKNNPIPIRTYISWRDIKPSDKKLICVFNKTELESDKVPSFLDSMLIKNPLYEKHEVIDEKVIIVFNFQVYADDWNAFLKGNYSELSETAKNAIKNYYGPTSEHYKYMDTYLNPSLYYDLYSELLDCPVSVIKSGKELCAKYDPVQEELITIIEDLQVQDNISYFVKQN